MGGWYFKKCVNIGNKLKKRQMFNTDALSKVSKQTRSEASKNKVMIKRVSNINKLSK